MKQIINRFSILTVALIISVSAMLSCDLSRETKGSADKELDKTEQAKPSSADNKKNNAKNVENKTSTDKNLLWDFRKAREDKLQQEVSRAETDVVLKYLLGDSWDKDLSITSRVSGAFTKAQAKETLYLVTGCEDDNGEFVSNAACGHVGWNTDGWIAIYNGTTPVMKIRSALGYGILKVTDVNGDGINEILSYSGYAQSGIQTKSMSLSQISDGKYQDLKTFQGYVDNCAFGPTLSADKIMAKALMVSYVPTKDGKMPEFTEEYFQGQCKDDQVDNSSWKATTKKDFGDFFASNS